MTTPTQSATDRVIDLMRRPSLSRPRPLLSVREVAEILGVSCDWVRDHASGKRSPRLPAVKLGDSKKSRGLWKFREEDVARFIEEQLQR